MRAIRITEFGGPEVLTLAEIPDPEPGPGQFLVEVSRAGINYADTHQAENTYLSRSTLPLIPGGEIVGRTAGGRRAGHEGGVTRSQRRARGGRGARHDRRPGDRREPGRADPVRPAGLLRQREPPATVAGTAGGPARPLDHGRRDVAAARVPDP